MDYFHLTNPTFSYNGTGSVNILFNDDGTMDIYPVSDWSGIENITIHAKGNEGNASGYMLITVNGSQDAPQLLSPSVSPNPGTEESTYTFTVNYLDPDNDPPVNLSLFIGGESFNLIEEDPNDVNFKDGKIYRITDFS